MDAKILRKWGLKADDAVMSIPSSPVSLTSTHSPVSPIDYNALRAWLPPIPHFERQRLSSETLRELTKACAAILKETRPDDADLDQTDALEEYKKAIARAEKDDVKVKEKKSDQRPPKNNRKDSPRTSGGHRVYQHAHAGIGLATSTGPDITTSHSSYTSQHSLPAFPQPPRRVETNKTRSSNPTNAEDYRQRPHNAVPSDHIAQDSRQSTRTTSRVTTAYATQAPETERSSLSYSANEQARHTQQRASGMSAEAPVRRDVQQRPGSSQAWVSQGRPQEEDINALPQLHKKPSRASLNKPGGLRSRAESIRDGIREYVRPGSRGSSRPATSNSNQRPQASGEESRPESRGSVASTSGNQRSWWRGAAGVLRGKGSFNSLRSSQNNSVTNLNEQVSQTRDAAPDLDKSLPPMPSLDTYVEPKVHISQLMVPAAPSVPQGSLASPADLYSPADIRSPVTLQAAPEGHGQQNYFAHTGVSYGTVRHTKSPALTPASENVPPQPRPLSSKTRTMPISLINQVPQQDVQPSEYQVNGVLRTYYSPAHEQATSDRVQFSDQWREELLQKDEARRRDQQRIYAIRKQEKKRLDAERRKTAAAIKGGKAPGGIKNRLSKMFGGGGGGAAAQIRPPPAGNSHNHPDSRQDDLDGKRRDRQREVLVAN